MTENNKKYNIPQEILYSVCLAAWKLCNENREKFARFKGYYTEAFIAEAIASVENAKRLPALTQTNAGRKIARIRLANAARQVMDNWQVLKLYATKAFDKSMISVLLEEAGGTFYKKASLYNWSALRSMIDEANIFIRNNMQALTANNNMPGDFKTKFAADGDTFLRLSTNFFSANLEKEKATYLKIAANNAIYERTIEMLKDGQRIFSHDAVNKRQFVFNYLVSFQRGQGTASLKGYITDQLNLPVEGVIVISENEKYSATTDSRGYYQISRMAHGSYLFHFRKPGYQSIEQPITLTEGTSAKGDFIMKKQMQLVA